MAKLNQIRYKDFTFPHNPETTGFRCDRSYIKHKYPELSGSELEDFGANAIIITGDGYFFGENAYTDFHKLYKQYVRNGVGDFRHPVFTEVTRGLMTNLEGTISPEKDAIKYSFEIVADTKPNVNENLKAYAVKEVKPTTSSTPAKSYKVGDIVYFKGGNHYTSSYSGAKGYSARAGKAKITLDPSCKGNGGVHPYHLIHTDNTSNVYGWVDKNTFE
jgi:hypothetical protein